MAHYYSNPYNPLKKFNTHFQYGDRAVGGAAHVPPGWDWWYGLLGNSRYYNYSLSINGTEKFFANDYLTDAIVKYFTFINRI